MEQFKRLVEIMAKLRGPGGCPWDAQQTHESLRPYLLEETYEVLDAIDSADKERLASELGDLLLQIVFHAQLASERGDFDIEEVCRRICDKLEYRHPHVFGEATVRGPEEVLVNWEQLKHREEEHSERVSVLDGVPKTLPALQQAEELQKRAARVGFDWPDSQGPWDKIAEEMKEIQDAVDSRQAEHELGDLLFAVCNYARFLKVDAESALRAANQRFARRFRRMEAIAAARGRRLAEMSLEEMEELWTQAKNEETSEA